MSRIQVRNDTLMLGDVAVRFMRTLRIPDDGRTYPLPPGLGTFPVRRVDDYLDQVPEDWQEHGGVFLPMYQREAMWLAFSCSVPHALKVGVGKVCALTGERWTRALVKKPQNYLVVPTQPWLDGISVGGGRIRQFVAMPLGMGYTVEGQVTGEERFGGIQLEAIAPKAGRFPPVDTTKRCMEQGAPAGMAMGAPPPPACAPMPAACAPMPAQERKRKSGAMGLGAGGRMKQKIYPDPHGIDSWDTDDRSRVYVHIVNSELWREITGEQPPNTPVTAREYEKHGYPWFDLYDETAGTLAGTETLKGVKSIKDIDADKSNVPLQDDGSVEPATVKKLWYKALGAFGVRDGDW